MKFQNHLNGGIIIGVISTGVLYKSNTLFELGLNNTNLFYFFSIIVIFSLMNDLDNVNSKIGKLFLPISIFFHGLSIFLYKLFYNKSYKTRKRLINDNYKKEASFFSKLFGIYKRDSLKQLFNVSHRMFFHTELGLITFLGIAYYINVSHFNFNDIYYLAIFIGYMTHLLLDWIHGKLPIFLTLRIIYIILGKRKEVYGLNKRIG